jgi:two-component system LytT family response regulator
MIKAILIDDEVHCLDTLHILLSDYCPEVTVLEKCLSAKRGLEAIINLSPDLVFLDIEMPVMNGFDLLKQFETLPFSVIFTTSYDQYAIKAIRFSALDYLLKPVDKTELQQAVQKAARKPQPPSARQFELLLEKLQQPKASISRIALPTMEGLQLVAVDNIVSCESESNYTIIHLKEQGRMVVSRTLKEIEELLSDHAFLRVHHSYLANLNEISRYIKGEGGYLIMNDGSHIDVSRSKKELLLKKLLPGKS